MQRKGVSESDNHNSMKSGCKGIIIQSPLVRFQRQVMCVIAHKIEFNLV